MPGVGERFEQQGDARRFCEEGAQLMCFLCVARVHGCVRVLMHMRAPTMSVCACVWQLKLCKRSKKGFLASAGQVTTDRFVVQLTTAMQQRPATLGQQSPSDRQRRDDDNQWNPRRPAAMVRTSAESQHTTLWQSPCTICSPPCSMRIPGWPGLAQGSPGPGAAFTSSSSRYILRTGREAGRRQ